MKITTEAVASLLQMLKLSLHFVGSTLNLTGYRWTKSTVVQNNTKYDYIIVGAGTAGCIIASRLAEDPGVEVLLVEAGGDPPIESIYPGLFTLLPNSLYDWNYTSVDDNYTAQRIVNKSLKLTSGKMLGGSSSLHHLIHSKGHPGDFDKWAEIINDESWSYKNLLTYMKKPEKLLAERVLESTNNELYGKDGEIKLSNDPNIVVDKYLNAFEEIGHRINSDANGLDTRGYANTVLYIADGVRQSGAEGFLKENKRNLHVLKNTEVVKIIFEGNEAIGVETKNEDFIYANIEVIICAGALNSPKLLMLSGIGPENELNKLGIKVVSNLPVGENLQDHPGVLIAHKMGYSDGPKDPPNPYKYPKSFIGFATFDNDNFAPDYQATNFIFPHDSSEIIQICLVLFTLQNEICQRLYEASDKREVLLTYLNILKPKSRGRIKLRSSNFNDPPLIYLNTFAEEIDLNNTAKALINFIEVQKSSFFKDVEADLVNLGLNECNNLDNFEFWKCYALNMVNLQWHFCGSCSIGSVVDKHLKVLGVTRLRVADASVMPTLTSGNINSAVMTIAEKTAALIKEERINCL